MNFKAVFRIRVAMALVLQLLAPLGACAQTAVATRPSWSKLIEVERFLNGLCEKAGDVVEPACISRNSVAEVLLSTGWCRSNGAPPSDRSWSRCPVIEALPVPAASDSVRLTDQQACRLLTFTASSAALWRDNGVPYERVQAYLAKLLTPMPSWSRKQPQWWMTEVSKIYYGQATPQDAQRLFEAQCHPPTRK